MPAKAGIQKNLKNMDTTKQRRSFSKGLWLLPILLSLMVNYNVLQNGYGWDDEDIVPNIRSNSPWWTALFPPQSDRPSFSDSPPYYRPMVVISYRLDFAIWDNNIFGFHLSVLIGHILNTALVYFLTQRLLTVSRYSLTVNPSSTHHSPLTTHYFIALIASSLFAVHPIHSEAVAWIAGRNDVFCTSFLLLSFLLYTYARVIPFFFSMLFFFMALLTKESAVGLVLLFPLYDYLVHGFPSRDKGYFSKNRGVGWRLALRAILPFFILGIYLAMRSGHPGSQEDGVNLTPFASSSAFLPVISAAGLYLKLMTLPYPHLPFISELPNSGSFLFFSILGWLAIFITFLYSVVYRKILPGIGLGWMIFTLAPPLMIAVLNVASTPAAERYVYAPSIGFLITGVYGVMTAGNRILIRTGHSKRTLAKMLGGVFVVLGVLWGLESRKRNTVWVDTVTFWEKAAIVSPESGDVHRALGVNYVRKGRQAEAEEHFLQSVSYYTKSSKSISLAHSFNELAGLYQSQNRHREAEIHYLRSLAIRKKIRGPEHPEVADSLYNLGLMYSSQGKNKKAEESYEQSLIIRRKSLGEMHLKVADVLNNMAILSYSRGDYEQAISRLNQALAIREGVLGPNHLDTAQTLNNLAVAYDTEGRYQKAMPLYQRALAIREKYLGPNHPDIAQTLNNMAALHYANKEYSLARPLYQRSIIIYEEAFNPDKIALADTLNNLAMLDEVQGQNAKAETSYKRALLLLNQSLGGEHSRIIPLLKNYAGFLKKMDRLEEAKQIKSQIKSIQERAD